MINLDELEPSEDTTETKDASIENRDHEDFERVE